jgi:hypothetical protein
VAPLDPDMSSPEPRKSSATPGPPATFTGASGDEEHATLASKLASHQIEVGARTIESLRISSSGASRKRKPAQFSDRRGI